MSSGDDSGFALGEEIETPYGRGIVQTIFGDKVTVLVRGRGSFSFDQSDLLERNNQATSEGTTSPGGRDHASSTSTSHGKTQDAGTEQTNHTISSIGNPTSDVQKPNHGDSGSSLPSASVEPKAGRLLGADDSETTFQRAAVEALRLGTVPRYAVEETTIGNSEHLDQIDRTLDESRSDDDGQVLLFTGPNGSGKSHLLRLTEERAIEAGFVVAGSKLEGKTKFTPKDVYREAMNSLQWPTESSREFGDLQHFLQRHDDELSDIDISGLSDCRIIHHLLQIRFQSGRELAPEVWNWLHGEEKYAKHFKHWGFKSTWLPLWGTAGQALANPMNGMAYLVRLLGYAGLVLVIDEVELILNQDIDWAIRGRQWVRGLILSTKGGSYRAENGRYFEEWEMDEYKQWSEWPGQNLRKVRTEWALRYGGVDPSTETRSLANVLPLTPCGSTPLVLALGYTNQAGTGVTVFDEEDGYQDSWLPEETVPEGILEMNELAQDQIEELLTKILNLYVQAYPGDEERVRNGLTTVEQPLIQVIQSRLRRGSDISIRWATQTIVEALDRIAAGESIDSLESTLSNAL